jgi:Flp pilus assembly protein TadD
MFLTHIDENGNDTPPILIPNSTAANRAVNIPEFVNRPYDAFNAIDVPAVDHHRHFYDGMDLIQDGDLDGAKELIEKALAEEPDFARALIALGHTLVKLGNVEEARVPLRRALELSPNSADAANAFNNLGLSYLREGNLAEAVRNFAIAIELEPDEPLPHGNMGQALYRLGEREQALQALATAARLSPNDANIRNDYGYVLHKLGKLDNAIAEYRAAIELDPEHSQARANLANAQRERDRKSPPR